MSHEDRLARMVSAGAISQAQADDLHRSTKGLDNSEPLVLPEEPRAKLPVGFALVALLVLLLVVMVATIGGTDDSAAIVQDVSQTMNQAGEVGSMNKSLQSSLFFGAIILVPLIFVIMTFMLTYNSLVSDEEEVLSSWAQVQSNIQRRSDLIPNLVTTVKTSMDHEKEVLTDVAKSRSGGLSEVIEAMDALESNKAISQVTKDNLADEAFMKALASEQARVGQNINKLMGVVENYPTLRSSDNFMSLQSQLEGTENRINR
ncbi:MAG: LemA family protein [Pseudomonadales bacterium]|nr:LemA family protein [Pseudomonadales bacterium]